MFHAKGLIAKIALIGLALVIVLSAVPALAAPAGKRVIKITPVSHSRFVQASVATQAPVKRIQMHIDNGQVKPNVQWTNQRQLTVRYALKNVAPGSHTARVTVWDAQNRSVRQQWSFERETPVIVSDKATILPGDTVRLTGQGFTPGFRVSVSMGGVNTDASGNYGSAIVEQDGQFSLDITVATYPDGSAVLPGEVVLVTHTTQWKEKATVQLRVQANPALSTSKVNIQPGERVKLTGQGFTPGTALTIGMGGVDTGVGGNYGAVVVGSTGRFALDVILDKYPDGTPLHAGTIVLLAHNTDGSEKAGVQIQVQATPSLSVDKAAIKSGEKLMVSGTGFTPGTAISIALGAVNTGAGGHYGSAVAGSNGSFSLAISPTYFPDGSPLRPGAIVLVAHNADGSEKASSQIQVLANPVLATSQSIIHPGDQVVLTGTGFTPGTAVVISMGDVNTGASGNYGSAVANVSGSFTLPVTLAQYPGGSPLQPGNIVLVAHNAGWQEKANVQLQVVAAPSLTADRSSIQPGDRVTVSGQGFSPGSAISLSLGVLNAGATGDYGNAVADGAGRFTLLAPLERYPNGSPLLAGLITLVAHNTSWDQKASVQLQVLTLTADKPTAQAGDRVVLTGQGFTPATVVSISLGWLTNGPAGAYGTAVVDNAGRFVVPVVLSRYPNGAALTPGTITLVAHDISWSQRASVQIVIRDAVPVAPVGLQVTSITKGATSAVPVTVGLRWQDNAANESGFRIRATITRLYGGTDSQVWQAPANSATSQVSFVSGGINPVTRACFTVSAYNTQGESVPSNQACIQL